MNKEELIGKLQMVYVGDRNALNELIRYYDGLKEVIDILQEENSRLKHLPKQIEQYILSEMFVNREVVAGWLQFDKLLKMIDRGMNNE